MANSRQYTDEELIQRVWDVEEIKKLIHKRVIYIANEMRKEELNDRCGCRIQSTRRQLPLDEIQATTQGWMPFMIIMWCIIKRSEKNS